MQAITFSQPGDPSVLRITDEPVPDLGANQILIAVQAAGVSRADTMQRVGKYPPPAGSSPILGLEVAGTIAAIGPSVTLWKVGDRVCALCNGGGYAEFVAVEAASLPENMFTVYDNLFRRALLKAGESILVHGGTSGIGTTAIMVARAFDARVFATAGSDEKVVACQRLGAERAFNYKRVDFVEAVRLATDGKGVDVILDLVGGDYIARDIEALAMDGRIAMIATTRGATAEVPIGKMMQKRATLIASALRPRTVEQKATIATLLREHVWPLLPARTPIMPIIDSTFPFEQAEEAHRRLESSAHIGKIVLTRG